MMRLIQLKRGAVRRIALVEEPCLVLLDGFSSLYDLAHSAMVADVNLSDLAGQRLTNDRLDYGDAYHGNSEWQILPAIDHPLEPARCLVSGTGLTHLGSARNRQAMHAAADDGLTDSMRMFRWGVEGGRPVSGSIGTSPGWFYKGTGTGLRAHGEALEVPAYAEDGGEEAEVAGIYLIAPDGRPHRIGMAAGNEFSDHRFEKKNYLYLASSKLRACSLGPELVVDPEFNSVAVRASIERAGHSVWQKEFRTGEAEMCHSLQNIEHHHFKFASHRQPGDLHVHFFGTNCLSFSDGIVLQDGDVMQVAIEGFGRPLRNPVEVAECAQPMISVIPVR